MEVNMRTLIVLLISLALVLVLPPKAEASFVEGFDSDNADWLARTINNSDVVADTSATWHSSNGNPGGNISGTVDNSADRLYALWLDNASSVFGDLTGLTLRTDYKISPTVDGPREDSAVRFFVSIATGGHDLFLSKYSWDPNDYTSWTTFQVPMVSSSFDAWPYNAENKSFDEVIAAPERIGLAFVNAAGDYSASTEVGFYSSGGATIYVDNFGAVPLPSAILLLASGLIGIVGIRRKFKG
jgi:hypothetical protein